MTTTLNILIMAKYLQETVSVFLFNPCREIGQLFVHFDFAKNG